MGRGVTVKIHGKFSKKLTRLPSRATTTTTTKTKTKTTAIIIIIIII
jgi:hypothetical protein